MFLFNICILIAFYGSVPILVAGEGVHDYCYSTDNDRYRYFGGKTPYDAVRAKKIKLMDPGRCTPLYVWGALRHPTRTCGTECRPSTEMKSLLGEIIDPNSLKICSEDIHALQSWQFKGLDESIKKPKYRIAPQGMTDIKEIAERLTKTLGKLLNPEKRTKLSYDFKTSSRDRCTEPAIAFANVLLNSDYETVEDANIEINDTFLKVEDQIEKKETPAKKAFQNSSYMDDVVKEVNERLGLGDKLKWDDVWQFYLFCSYENSWRPDVDAELCAVFTPEHLKMFEYLDDIMIYFARGYGSPSMNEDFANRFIGDLMTKLNTAAKHTIDNIEKVGAFYIVHSNTLIPIFKKFNLYREDDNKEISLKTFSKKFNKRNFRSSLFNGFSANFMAILFDCSGDHYVSFYVNENLLEIPICNNKTTCSLAQLNKVFKKEIANFSGTSSSKA